MPTEQQAGHAERSFELPWDRPVTRRDLFRYGGALGFGAVGASLLASCGPISSFTSARDAATMSSVPPAAAKYLVIVIVDAGRGDYLGYGHLPNIRKLMANGTYYPYAFSGIMEATTPACHAALGTGSFPKNDGGVLGFWWENPSTIKVLPAQIFPIRPRETPPLTQILLKPLFGIRAHQRWLGCLKTWILQPRFTRRAV